MIHTTSFCERSEVTQIRLSRELNGEPLYWTAAYLVGGLLVDTGCPYTAGELMALLEGRRVDLVVNTHEHEDHIGANCRLELERGLTCLAHPKAIPFIRRPPPIEEYRRVTWGEAGPSAPRPLGDRVSVDGGRAGRRLELEVLHTPGHSPGHVTFVERDRGWCFTGDLFVGERFRVSRREEDFTALARSLALLAGVDTAAGKLTLFTGIGRVVEDGRRALSECLDHLRTVWLAARRLRDEEGLDPPTIRDRLFGRESTFAFLTGGHYSSENFIRCLLDADLEEV